ncbi:hypothetical protein SLEP1_g38222 [Rubroshorea leprosula]|uniref:DDE Tnp4 domain-containing protein n=1 Tax=Rubroshorea leprosula TaxID=152421 RepID=A0AAV5KXR6_9ROSI|nr:hypothetical protein SLEP1_g38222 [Rubroshorea leprosula]
MAKPRLMGSRWRTQARGFVVNPGSWVRREPSLWVPREPASWVPLEPASWVRREPLKLETASKSSRHLPHLSAKSTDPAVAGIYFDTAVAFNIDPGWEGIASDSRIIKDALKREDKLIIPEGKFYLVDSGFMLKSGLITPYRGVCYHLKEYSNNPPQNAKELCNLRHAALRNAIERAFGVLKRRFEILRGGTESLYGVRTQNLIILACCIIHIFLIGVDPDEELIVEVDMELRNQENLQQTRTSREEEEDASRGEMLRDVIVVDMWHNYKNC